MLHFSCHNWLRDPCHWIETLKSARTLKIQTQNEAISKLYQSYLKGYQLGYQLGRFQFPTVGASQGTSKLALHCSNSATTSWTSQSSAKLPRPSVLWHRLWCQYVSVIRCDQYPTGPKYQDRGQRFHRRMARFHHDFRTSQDDL